MIKKNISYQLILIAIIILATILRFYKLNKIPLSLYWDETAIIYNAWSISLTGQDEWGSVWPLAFRSFGDYKAPLAIYTLAAIYKIIGLQESALRVLIAFSGLGTVVVTYFLANHFFSRKVGLISSALMAISPWAVNVSRVGFEATIALLLSAIGLLGLVSQKKGSLWWGSAALILSLYSYHSTKIVIPFLLIGLWIFLSPKLQKINIKIIVFWVIGLIPLFYSSIFGHALARYESIFSITPEATAIRSTKTALQTTVENSLSQTNWRFWLNGQDGVGLRHGVPGSGNIYWWQVPFAFVGILEAWRRQKIGKFILFWIIIGLLPSIVTSPAPHTIRSLLALIPLQLVIALGIYKILIRWAKYQTVIILLTSTFVVIETSLYLQRYYTLYPHTSASNFQFGYKEAVLAAKKWGAMGEKVIMTDTYKQPYIYVLLYRRIKPQEYLSGGLANYEFRPIHWPESFANTVYIGSPSEIPPNDPLVVETITIPETSTIAFVIAKTP